MTQRTELIRKAAASRRRYKDLLELDASGVVFDPRVIPRARKTWETRKALAEGRVLSV